MNNKEKSALFLLLLCVASIALIFFGETLGFRLALVLLLGVIAYYLMKINYKE